MILTSFPPTNYFKSRSTIMVLEGRIVVDDNRYADRGRERAYGVAADITLIRMVLAIETCLGFIFGSAYIKSAYKQCGPNTWESYVRTPMDFNRKRWIVFRLLKFPYGRVDSVSQWSKKIEGWILNYSYSEKVFGVPHLFVKKTGTSIDLLVAKVADYFLVSGRRDRIKSYMDELKISF